MNTPQQTQNHQLLAKQHQLATKIAAIWRGHAARHFDIEDALWRKKRQTKKRPAEPIAPPPKRCKQNNTIQAAKAHAGDNWASIRDQVHIFAKHQQQVHEAARDLAKAIDILVQADSDIPWVSPQHPAEPAHNLALRWEPAPAVLQKLIWTQNKRGFACPASKLIKFIQLDAAPEVLEKLIWIQINQNKWGFAWTEFLLTVYKRQAILAKVGKVPNAYEAKCILAEINA